MLTSAYSHSAQHRPGKQRGSILIEAMVAVLIFSMGVLSLVGLQSAMAKNSSDNRYRAQALLIAQSHLANMMAYGVNASSYIQNVDAHVVQTQLPNGSIAFSSITNSMVTVTVGWQVPGGNYHEVNASSYVFDVEE
jgi:type IV pilus assembly protein PilV